MTPWHPQECPYSSCSLLFLQRCEGPSLQLNTCGIITAQAWNKPGQKTCPQSGQKQHPSWGAGEIPSLYVRGDWRRWGCTSMSSPLWPQGEGDRLRTVACIVCLYTPPTSSTLPPLHPVSHPTEDWVNSSLRSLHLAGTQSCTALYVSPGPAGERLKLQRLFSYDSLPAEPGWRE